MCVCAFFPHRYQTSSGQNGNFPSEKHFLFFSEMIQVLMILRVIKEIPWVIAGKPDYADYSPFD